jgi:hypothetical protein
MHGEEAELAEESSGKPRVKVIDRRQMMLRPTDVEGLVEADHPARAIWELTGRLDLNRFYEAIEAMEGTAGRPAMDPRLMISLWIYAYSEGVSSARITLAAIAYSIGRSVGVLQETAFARMTVPVRMGRDYLREGDFRPNEPPAPIIASPTAIQDQETDILI